MAAEDVFHVGIIMLNVIATKTDPNEVLAIAFTSRLSIVETVLVPEIDSIDTLIPKKDRRYE